MQISRYDTRVASRCMIVHQFSSCYQYAHRSSPVITLLKDDRAVVLTRITRGALPLGALQRRSGFCKRVSFRGSEKSHSLHGLLNETGTHFQAAYCCFKTAASAYIDGLGGA